MAVIQRYSGNDVMPPHTVEHPYIRINGNSGYSRHGDIVSLFVDRIDNENADDILSGDLAVQLWACETPYSGGRLTGWKLAEHQLGTLRPKHYLAPVTAEVPADFPESGDYAITLMITEWGGEGYDRIHDFHNYPSRDLFVHPCLKGPVEYQCPDAQRLVVQIGRIENPREPENLSGTLALELWALPESYAGGAFAGHALAAVTLGSLSGGETWQDCSYELEMKAPPPGTYALVLMLREWVGGGYVTRDHVNLTDEMTFPIVAAVHQASEIGPADVPADRRTGQSQPPQPTRDAAVHASVGPVGQDAESVAPNDTQSAPPAQGTPSAYLRDGLDKLKSFLRRTFKRLKESF